MEIFLEVCEKLSSGFLTAFFLFALTLLFALPLGLVMSFCTMSKHAAVRVPMKILVWVLRGTPLMLQIFAIFYLLFQDICIKSAKYTKKSLRKIRPFLIPFY